MSTEYSQGALLGPECSYTQDQQNIQNDSGGFEFQLKCHINLDQWVDTTLQLEANAKIQDLIKEVRVKLSQRSLSELKVQQKSLPLSGPNIQKFLEQWLHDEFPTGYNNVGMVISAKLQYVGGE